MMDLHTKDDKEMIVKSTLQSPAVLELDQILDIQGPKIPSWGNRPMCGSGVNDVTILYLKKSVMALR